ncbi:MAG TPA: Smr/MutS family protein [Bacteroidales bacterium]|nr:Smr/MutS family protein [Bacteroidales bacterium]
MVYPSDFENKIGFDRIRKLTSGYCLSASGRDKCEAIGFSDDQVNISRKVSETYEFQQISILEDDFPIDHYYDLTACLKKIKVEGSYPDHTEIFDLKRSLGTIKSVYRFFREKNSKENKYPFLGDIAAEIKLYPFVSDAIDRIISKDGSIKDNASPELEQIRAELKKLSSSVSRKLHSILKQSQSSGIVEQGTTIAIRNGRGVIPVSVYDKNKIKGLIHDQSATGKTVFIEPEEVVAINNQITELEYSEKREIIKILIAFADSIRPYLDELIFNFDILATIDLIRAKGLLANRLKAVCPVLSADGDMEWIEAIHPILFMTFASMAGRKVVPLDIRLNMRERIILISGPNAGGKSVCLKTVGLLQYMYQCGFTVPVREGSTFTVFKKLFIDIGDEQNLENDLSTYSSHLLNMKHFLKNADRDTLILIDEFGTGTEPMLGGSIAEAILSRLNEKMIFGVLTTHYTNLKHYASSANGIVNGAMMFDNHLMQPLFRLEIGKPGSSFAFEIARKIGLPEEVLGLASQSVGEEHISFDRHLKDILRDKRYWERKRDEIRRSGKKLDELVDQYESEISNLKIDRKEILESARKEAGKIINDANRIIENTIRQIKESQAEKERTREARGEITDMKAELAEMKVQELKIEEKFRKLKEKERRIRREKQPAEEKEKIRVQEKTGPVGTGDHVTIEGTSSVGEVLTVKGKRATVAFGNMVTSVDTGMLRHASEQEVKFSKRGSERAVTLDWDMSKRRSKFKPEVDVRGMRAEEALNVVRDMVDEAVMVQYPTLRILHGKGDGILRQVIREYLTTADMVSSCRDEHVEAGGSGITVAEIDLREKNQT